MRLQSITGVVIVIASLIGFLALIGWGGWQFVAIVVAWWLLRRVRDLGYYLIMDADEAMDAANREMSADWGPPRDPPAS